MRSNRFYELALVQNPDDYEAAYRLGLNYYVELKSADKAVRRGYHEKGLAYFERAASTPGSPDKIRKLVASVSSRLGKHQLSLQYLVDLYMQTDDVEQKQALRERIERLKVSLGKSSGADEALEFRKNWQATYPYLPSSLYSIMGEPKGQSIHDKNWRQLVTDAAFEGSSVDEETRTMK